MEKIDSKENQEFVTFELIQDSLGFTNPKILKKYLASVFNDLANQLNTKNKKFMTTIVFFDYIKLPILIMDKVYEAFNISSSKGLIEEEFVDNLFRLYMSPFEESIKLIFNILDFDKDGILQKDDVRLFLCHLPLFGQDEEERLSSIKRKNDIKTELFYKIYEIQLKGLDEIDDIIDDFFYEFENGMNLGQFTKITIEKNSEIFLQILCFLYDQMPFSSLNVDAMLAKYNLTKEENDKMKEKEINKKEMVYIKMPKKDTLLSPMGIFFKKFNIKPFSLKEIENNINKLFITDNNDNNNLDNNENSNKNNLKRKKSKSLSHNRNNKIINIKEMDNSKVKEIISSQNIKDKNNINILENKSKNVEKKLKKESYLINNNNNNIKYENWVYKITDTNNILKFYLVLINKDIYYYKSETKKEFVGMHNLSGCFIQQCKEKKAFLWKNYYSFEIYFKNKSKERKFYTLDEFVCKTFVYLIKKAVGYADISELYEMGEKLGNGAFGLVVLGRHIKTKTLVAIKILTKKNIKTLSQNESVRKEIGILKLCHHPFIVRLLDYLEDNEYIYIVTEYIEGGNLNEYFKNNKFDFTEKQAANIMKQIASGIIYLNQYGIVHRDLKPNNIMITQPNDSGIIKIADFGLSKIISPNEIIISHAGTLNFMAPEILLGTPYNNEVDIWAIGVILFYMLSGDYPFEGGSDSEIYKKITYHALQFNYFHWKERSDSVKNLIESCLEKNMDQRIDIYEFINHPWFSINE